MLLELLIREMFLVLECLPLISCRLVLRVLQNVFHLFACETDSRARDIEWEKEVECCATFPPGVGNVVSVVS